MIELLIVLVIIGVLAMIAIPRFQDMRGKANEAALKSDLRNLYTAEDGYLFDHDAYTSSAAALNFTPSPGIVLTITAATASGWSATVSHPPTFPEVCGIFVGNVLAQPPATVEGLIGCQ